MHFWVKLIDIGFKGVNITDGASINRFDELLDTFSYSGNDQVSKS
jgi:hypothetical protein